MDEIVERGKKAGFSITPPSGTVAQKTAQRSTPVVENKSKPESSPQKAKSGNDKAEKAQKPSIGSVSIGGFTITGLNEANSQKFAINTPDSTLSKHKKGGGSRGGGGADVSDGTIFHKILSPEEKNNSPPKKSGNTGGGASKSKTAPGGHREVVLESSKFIVTTPDKKNKEIKEQKETKEPNSSTGKKKSILDRLGPPSIEKPKEPKEPKGPKEPKAPHSSPGKKSSILDRVGPPSAVKSQQDSEAGRSLKSKKSFQEEREKQKGNPKQNHQQKPEANVDANTTIREEDRLRVDYNRGNKFDKGGKHQGSGLAGGSPRKADLVISNRMKELGTGFGDGDRGGFVGGGDRGGGGHVGRNKSGQDTRGPPARGPAAVPPPPAAASVEPKPPKPHPDPVLEQKQEKKLWEAKDAVSPSKQQKSKTGEVDDSIESSEMDDDGGPRRPQKKDKTAITANSKSKFAIHKIPVPVQGNSRWKEERGRPATAQSSLGKAKQQQQRELEPGKALTGSTDTEKEASNEAELPKGKTYGLAAIVAAPPPVPKLDEAPKAKKISNWAESDSDSD